MLLVCHDILLNLCVCVVWGGYHMVPQEPGFPLGVHEFVHCYISGVPLRTPKRDKQKQLSGWWFQICFIFIPIRGNDPIRLINIFSDGLKPPTSWCCCCCCCILNIIYLNKKQPTSCEGLQELWCGIMMVEKSWGSKNLCFWNQGVTILHLDVWLLRGGCCVATPHRLQRRRAEAQKTSSGSRWWR